MLINNIKINKNKYEYEEEIKIKFALSYISNFSCLLKATLFLSSIIFEYKFRKNIIILFILINTLMKLIVFSSKFIKSFYLFVFFVVKI